jgi:hypothetical protein
MTEETGLAPKCVLVTGTAFTLSAGIARVARMIGTTLAEARLGLVTGNSTGVDKWVSQAYCGERHDRGEALAGAFVQLLIDKPLRSVRWRGLPMPGYRAPRECRVAVADAQQWRREALLRSHAAIMIAGGRGALDMARRCIERGRPVFPLPFTGGNSAHVFHEILKTWDSHPVPGLSRTQFLRLAEPWVAGTGALSNLLRGTLADYPDIFVSYRRTDASAAAGRIAHDLAEYFGFRRVFLDVHGIAPSRKWEQTVDDALARCKAGIVVIGRDWLASAGNGGSRLHADADPVRLEIQSLLAHGKPLFPVLVEGATLPPASALPEPLRVLDRYQAITFDNGSWTETMRRLIQELETIIRGAQRSAEER